MANHTLLNLLEESVMIFVLYISYFLFVCFVSENKPHQSYNG